MSTTTEKWTIFGERLKTELDRQEISLRQFAEKAGLTLTTACRYVHSQRTPRATEILKAAKVLGVTCDYMLGLSDDPHKTRDGWAKAGFHELPSAQPETHEERTETHACDLISRNAAIDALTSHIMPHNNEDGTVTIGVLSKSSIKNILNKLPSAQADSKETSSTHKALDTISRQDAIRIVDGIDTWQAGWRGNAIESMKALPSAQSEPIRINLNEPIKVKLTDWGKEIYYHQYDRTNQIAGREICKPMFPREDENGYTEFQLWCFIELYGMHMGITLPNVIEPLEIVYER